MPIAVARSGLPRREAASRIEAPNAIPGTTRWVSDTAAPGTDESSSGWPNSERSPASIQMPRGSSAQRRLISKVETIAGLNRARRNRVDAQASATIITAGMSGSSRSGSHGVTAK